jgi:hypothetical protein
MQKRLYAARRINVVTEKPGRLSGFSPILSCISQLEQNETDEPPSQFNALNAGIGLHALSQIKTHPLRITYLPSSFFISEINVPEENIFSPFSVKLQQKGFIVRDNMGRIKTIIFGKKRST